MFQNNSNYKINITKVQGFTKENSSTGEEGTDSLFTLNRRLQTPNLDTY